MGYGEIGGGGSVLWHVQHGGNGGNGQGGANGGRGRDPRPQRSEGGTFTILVNGTAVAQDVAIDFDNPRQIQIIWSPDTLADLPRLQREAIQAAAGGGPASAPAAPGAKR